MDPERCGRCCIHIRGACCICCLSYSHPWYGQNYKPFHFPYKRMGQALKTGQLCFVPEALHLPLKSVHSTCVANISFVIKEFLIGYMRKIASVHTLFVGSRASYFVFFSWPFPYLALFLFPFKCEVRMYLARLAVGWALRTHYAEYLIKKRAMDFINVKGQTMVEQLQN